MNYIVLDMEWNQPGLGDIPVCHSGVFMKNEIVQIGAVKLDENKCITEKFDSVVKPEFIKTMNRTVSRLTGITDEMLFGADTFKVVLERFKAWCGSDFVFLIWGYDDIRILKNNISFHGLDASWLPEHYNIQMIFCTQNNLERRQYSLAFALEFCKIDKTSEFHDALNDAEYTALVCATLDLEKGIQALKGARPIGKDGNSDEGETYLVSKRKFKAIDKKEDIWSNGFISRPTCPFCSSKMSYEKAVRVAKYKYCAKAKCSEHGEFVVVLKLSQTPELKYSVSRKIFVLNEATEKLTKPRKARLKIGARPKTVGAKG